MAQLTVPADYEVMRVDRALAVLYPDVSRATVQRWIAEGRVRVGGLVCKAKAKVGPGAVIEFEPGPTPGSSAEPDASVQFEVVYEDPHLIVVNKPAGLVVHPGKGNRHGTLVNGLLARPGFGRPPADDRDPEGFLRPGVVHRIDKDTSGLLVIAKDERTREGLKELFARHDIERVYWALTLGVPAAGTISTLHGRHPDQRLKFSTKVRDGKRAVTKVKLHEAFGTQAALISCQLETGRTHQIRVHLAEVRGTPLLGDVLYGKAPRHTTLEQICGALKRQALHAAVLGFVHPISGKTLHFEAALPPDLAQVLSGLRGVPRWD